MIVITPQGVGMHPSITSKPDDYTLASGEFTVANLSQADWSTKVLAEDLVSLRDPLPGDNPKQALAIALAAQTYTLLSGSKIQTRSKDEGNIRLAIEKMERLGETSIDWIMADNTKESVSLSEMKTLYDNAVDAGFAIHKTYTDTLA